MPFLPLIIGAGIGLAQAGEQGLQANKQSKIAAADIAYSPWTKANINDAQNSIHPATFATDVLGGAMAGARYGQGLMGGSGGSASGDSTPAGSSYNLQNGGPTPYSPSLGVGTPAPTPWNWKITPYGSS